jgi:SAM-dependent methyltransferase
VLLLGRILARQPAARLLEVGCATGELCRYLHLKHPSTRYHGLDVSRAALERAREKYPQDRFLLHDPEAPLARTLHLAGLSGPVEVVYSKDVVHHQTDPFGFLGQLLDLASDATVVRLRTRDRGETVLDPELSCQYHYNGWMPYLVLNLEETVDYVRRRHPKAEVTVQRHRMVLGGKENRCLPKDCYLPEVGTAETALAILLKTDRPGEVTVEDKPDMRFPEPWTARLRRGR